VTRSLRRPVAPALLAAVALLVGAVTACSGTTERLSPVQPPAARADVATLRSSGCSLAAPLVEQWTAEYRRVAPGVTLTHTPSGSPAALRRFAAGETELACTGGALTEDDRILLGVARPVRQVPVVAAGVAVAYNLPGVTGLRLSARALALVLRGEVTRWDDAVIRSDNPRLALPGTAIRVVYRSDASESTRLLGQFLGTVVPGDWDQGAGTRLTSPVGTGAEGAEGVARAVAGVTGSIGYTTTDAAARAPLATAAIDDASRRFVRPAPETVAAAVSASEFIFDGLGFRLYFGPGVPEAYPLSTFVYLVYDRALADPNRRAAVEHVAAWILGEGQRTAERLGYAPVPLGARTAVLDVVSGLDPARPTVPPEGRGPGS
jgi:phosphate transport system substrate-binding protein